MTESKLSKWGWGILAWLVAIIIFFPIFLMIITAFKNEREAQSLSLFFLPTLESFHEVFARSNYAVYVWNSSLASRRMIIVIHSNDDSEKARDFRHGIPLDVGPFSAK
jgi:ABC-type glycerol-3-phosphate transport system permease component